MNNFEVLNSVTHLIKLMAHKTIDLAFSVPATLIDYWELTLTFIGFVLAAISYKKLFR